MKKYLNLYMTFQILNKINPDFYYLGLKHYISMQKMLPS